MATGGRYTNTALFTWIYSPERVEAWRRYMHVHVAAPFTRIYLPEEKKRRQDPRQIDAEMAIDMFQWCRENEGKPAMRNLSTGRKPKTATQFSQYLAKELGPNWGPLAIELGFEQQEIDTLTKDNPQDTTAQCRKMLVNWFNRQISNACAMQTLSQALKDTDRVDLALETKYESRIRMNTVVTNGGKVDDYMTECLKLMLKTLMKKKGNKYVKDMFRDVFEECEGVDEGSVGLDLIISVKSRDALDKLWNKFSSGSLAKELTKILITDELTTGDKSDLAIKATMLESDYQRACKFFDEQANGTEKTS